MDFFSVEALTPFGLVRYLVLFVIDVPTRRIQICGIKHRPSGEWMQQMARNLTVFDYGFLVGKKAVIHDRDPLFTEAFCELLKAEGSKPIQPTARIAKFECLRRTLWVRILCGDRVAGDSASLREF